MPGTEFVLGVLYSWPGSLRWHSSGREAQSPAREGWTSVETCVWQHITETSDSGLDESEDSLFLSLEKSGGGQSGSSVTAPRCGERAMSLLILACTLLPV